MFINRADAGKQLAERLRFLQGQDVVVLGLPRGGVPVAFAVARALDAPLDVIVVRKLGVPYQHELAMGAIGEGGVRVLNDDVIRIAELTMEEVRAVEQSERVELRRRTDRYREGRKQVALSGRIAVVVDDGIATGATARVACRVARAQGAARVVLAAPVAAAATLRRLAEDADEIVCVTTPRHLFAVGEWYGDFHQVADHEVIDFLREAAAGRQPDPEPAADPPSLIADVDIPAGTVRLPGQLTVPDGAAGIVAFAHGSGSSRHSPRNRFVADVLHTAGLGTLLFDLLTPAEETRRANVFDIGLLAARLADATRWLRAYTDRIGYFGASTGAAAALWAAAAPGADIAAVVSRGGRPDLAGPRLSHVSAPTLLIVGSRDELVLELNRRAQEQLRCRNDLAVVAGATHLFEEPGTLRQAADLARDWFRTHLPASPSAPAPRHPPNTTRQPSR